jgi:MYXO-CTERM domain-containing protein
MDNCPQGETCVMGMCTTAGSDAGMDAASESGGGDAGRDGTAGDSGSGSSSSSSGAGSSSGSGSKMEAGASGGTMEDGSTGGPTEGGANADAPVSLEGGGCAAAGDPASSLVTWGALGAVFAAAGVVRRRRGRDR